jgi:lipoyl(octanoyl) transferase
MMYKKKCIVKHLGRVPYQQAWDLQNVLAEKIAAGEHPQTLLLLEHPHTYTLGRRGDAENLLWTKEKLEAKGVDVLWVDRGGDITYHGPGQLVGYPLLRLASIGWQGNRLPQADYVGYIRQLEEVIIQTLAAFEVEGFRMAGKTGVWVNPKRGVDPEKIASIGVKVDAGGVSRHGFALNVHPDMSYWEGIVPCGLADVTMTSMADRVSGYVFMEEVLEILAGCFGQVFKMQMARGGLQA